MDVGLHVDIDKKLPNRQVEYGLCRLQTLFNSSSETNFCFAADDVKPHQYFFGTNLMANSWCGGADPTEPKRIEQHQLCDKVIKDYERDVLARGRDEFKNFLKHSEYITKTAAEKFNLKCSSYARGGGQFIK